MCIVSHAIIHFRIHVVALTLYHDVLNDKKILIHINRILCWDCRYCVVENRYCVAAPSFHTTFCVVIENDFYSRGYSRVHQHNLDESDPCQR